MEDTVKSKSPLATKKVSRLIMKYSIPAIIGMLVSALYNICDQIYIGHGVGMLGNAATNVAFPFTMICTAFLLMIGVGTAAKFNLSMGEGNKDTAKKVLGTGITMLFAIGIILCIISFIFLEPLLKAFGATSQVLPYAVTYTRINAIGFPFLIVSLGSSHLIRADGSPLYSMVCVLTGAIINSVLDPIFMFVFKWGMHGAALSNIIGQIASFILVMIYLTRFKTFKIKSQYLKPDLKYVKIIALLGMGSFVNHVAMTTTQIIMNNTLTAYGAQSIYGEDIPLACAGVIAKVSIVFMAFVIGTAQGCQPIFGFNYGAKNYKRVKQTYIMAFAIITCFGVSAFLCFQFIPRQIISIFGHGDELYFQFAIRYFRVYLSATFLMGIIPLSANFFTAIGKSIKGIFINSTRQILFLIPLILILPLFLGIDGVLYAGPTADGAAILLAAILVFFQFKKLTKMNVENNNDNIENIDDLNENILKP